MASIPDGSVDLILCDLPYGKFKTLGWDSVISFEALWPAYWRVLKANGAVVLFGKNPFTARVVVSQEAHFRYEMIWQKDKGTDFGNANIKPLNIHENILVFYKEVPTYNKQMQEGAPYTKKNNRNNFRGDVASFETDNSGLWVNKGERTPVTVVRYARDNIHKGTSLHPTQKPVALLEYLIKTYTNEGETVLDNCMGSGSTGVACVNTNRSFVGIEKDDKYFETACNRIKEAKDGQKLA
jgi:site-specific DNA-methyltransferase (adenine-specific)